MSIHPIEQRRASEAVRAQLIDLIEKGHYKLNDRLPSEAELAQSFSVSRSVVREALNSLNAFGLTKSYAGKGTFVASTELNSRLLIGRFLPPHLGEVRRALEVPSARLAAERRGEEDLTRLEELVTQFAATEENGKRVKIDADFHIAIAAATGNPLFPRLIADLRDVLQEQALELATIEGRTAQAAREHQDIFDAIMAGDGDAAARAMDAHLEAVEGHTTKQAKKKS
ncbi:FadR/GntR family transcriptional regulator [Nonomuraea sp. M3C6]|uniref:FadR/GntR family transcriptional regulator n=1 Tax=Nonomuraea marmarensis TaxID=3351344 RepID=A0ABW7AHT6_9ACTN